MITIRLLLAALLGAALTPAQADNLPPASHFFDNPLFNDPVLSPDGRYVAMKVARPDGREMLGVQDLESGKRQIVARFDDADIGQVQWISDKRLLFNAKNNDAGELDNEYAPGLYAVDRDGQRYRQLATRAAFYRRDPTMVNQRVLPWNVYMLEQTGAQDSDWAYVQQMTYDRVNDRRISSLLRLDTVSARTKAVPKPANTTSWLLDSGGEPRLVSTLDKNVAGIHVLIGDEKEWHKLASFEIFSETKHSFEPLAFGADGALYVSSNKAGNYKSLHTFNFSTGEVNPAPLIQLGEYDFDGHLLTSNGKVAGLRYLRETFGTHWFDTEMQKIQGKIDTLLPHTVNLVDIPARPAFPYLLVKAYSDVQPAIYLIYNKDTSALTRLGETYPSINPHQMGTQKYVRYKARDGLQIPATLTLPRSSTSRPPPMVVMVHGGPYVRGSQWGWNPEVQFLASRGYAVLEPEFRGSTGFGTEHFRSGWKQWGLKMQDDIADGAKWAIANQYADPGRICIAGASYGGYATLMGLINDPDLYKCGINWTGVTDIKLLYTGHWMFHSDLSETWKQYGMPELVGDLQKDADQLRATSPLEQASRVRQPLILAYGAVDQRVPLVHGTRFRDAVKTVNGDVEWIEYQEEGHGWRMPKNRIDFWTRVEKFLNRHIGPKQE